jgi:NTP pyrophosphatase (non-canonical NTP hydrolase)
MRLDDLYKMTAYIYQDANLSRSREATFLHFVEVCGMLTASDRKKKKVAVDVPGALCKALGWYFPLLAKMGISSVEELVFSKFPGVCPYCRKKPHIDKECKLVKGAEGTTDHERVIEAGISNRSELPKDLNGWQIMFDEIYPRTSLTPQSFSTVALFEELGELAESIRVFDRFPHYFYGEAADTFSYLMGLANEYSFSLDEEQVFDFQSEYMSRFPGLCINCGSRSCICPPIPQATIGRMAKELKIDASNFVLKDQEQFFLDGEVVAREVFETVGFDPAIGRHLPYDRGDLNAALTQLFFRLANATESAHPEVAEKLRHQASEIVRADRGAAASDVEPSAMLATLREAWSVTGSDIHKEIRDAGKHVSELTHLLERRILVVTANPDGESGKALRLDQEVRCIKDAFARNSNGIKVDIEPLPAATIDDFRRIFLQQEFDIVHFSGHADSDGLSFLDGAGQEAILSYDALSDIIKRHPGIQAVVLNACHSLETIEEAFAPLVIGMMDEIDDDAAVAFSTGFYDAIAAGRTVDQAFDEGTLTMRTKKFSSHHVAKLRSR